ncbi:Fatty acid synthase [Sergentomyia squamirostris]
MVYSKKAENLKARTHAESPDEEIVITGMSGKFPKSSNINEFAKNLYERAELLDEMDPVWKKNFPNLPEKIGRAGNVKKFDATFFGVHFKQAHLTDPALRFILEAAYEAIIDAGVNPQSLRNRNIGVFIGSSYMDMDKIFYVDKLIGGGFALTGCNRAMLANRISYAFDLHGPSFHIDSLSNATLSVIDTAYASIRNGQCEAAIIGGTNVILHPCVTTQLELLGLIPKDGVTRTFDKDSTGSNHSEATCVMFLQKAKDAKRIYARIVHSKINYSGYREDIFHPNVDVQTQLLKDFYREIDIEPTDVNYVEVHGEGILKYDVAEMKALDTVFCGNRKTPLKIGCVKSNIGNTQPAGGICGLVKCIVSMENNSIPPNMNLNQIHPDLRSIVEGRMEVVKEAQQISGRTFMAINSLSFLGSNSHLLIESGNKEKINHGAPEDDVPRLVMWSSRTEEGVNRMFDHLTNIPLDAEYVALLQEVQVETSSKNLFRGYGLFQKGEDGGNATSLGRDVQHFSGVKRPIVWVFSGMGSQWNQMGSSLMRLPIFRKSIEFCHEVLKPKNIDLIGLLTSDDPTTYDNILHSFVGIAAIQIAIVDILRVLDMKPDIIVGHSVGELGCAYADGCFTAEEMILSAYSRGKVSVETEKIFGSMAAVGLGFKKVRSLLPADIEVACRNSSISSTISGPAKSVETFVDDLKKKGIFAKEVPCSNIAYHSRYIADMGPKLLEYLTDVIKEPKKRSAKWLSTSVPQAMWDMEESQYSSAEYHTNNLLNPVLFEDTFTMIPNNALTIEIAPHGLLQAIIRKSKSQAVHIPLTQRGNSNNAHFFLSALGKLYMNGMDIPMQNLYPKIEFPVSRGTPMISPLIEWDHAQDWFVPAFIQEYSSKAGKRTITISPDLQEFSFINDHLIDGKLIFPAMGWIFSIWETFTMLHDKSFSETNIEFTDVRFVNNLDLTEESQQDIWVLIQPGTGHFQICDETTCFMTGYVSFLDKETRLEGYPEDSTSEEPTLTRKTFYKELYMRGFEYRGSFQNVLEVRTDGCGGKIKFYNNWVTFLNGFLQILTIGEDTRDLMMPKAIRSLKIKPQDILQVAKTAKYHNVHVCKEMKTIFSEGIEIIDMELKCFKKSHEVGLAISEYYKFVPHLPAEKMSTANASRVCVQVFADNYTKSKIKVIEVDSSESPCEIISSFRAAVDALPHISGILIYLSARQVSLPGVHVECGKISSQKQCNIIIGHRCFMRKDFLRGAFESLAHGGYLVSREEKSVSMELMASLQGFTLILYIPTDTETLVVFKKISRKNILNSTILEIPEHLDREMLRKINNTIQRGPITLVSRASVSSGITRFVNSLRKKFSGKEINCFSIEDKSCTESSYRRQMQLSLATNVFHRGKWGSFRDLKLETDTVAETTDKLIFVNFISPGSELVWTDGNADDCHAIDTVFCGLNHHDGEIVTGHCPLNQLPINLRLNSSILGTEYVGIDRHGHRMMGVVKNGALATKIMPDNTFTFRIPNTWTLEEACTVPMAYLTIYWTFFFRASVKPKESILIHSGTDDLGIAAIRIAIAYGLNVFTTVDSMDKKYFLMKIFPNLKEDHIINYVEGDFELIIKKRTEKGGVNYVLSTMKQDVIQQSMRCILMKGTHLQLGKADMMENEGFGIGIFLNEISFTQIDVGAIFRDDCELKEKLAKMFREDIEKGIIQPIPATIFNADEVNQAFDHFTSEKKIGKVLLRIRNHQSDKVSREIHITHRFNGDRGKSYIVFGGLDGFGIEFSDWLVTRGATKLILTSYEDKISNYQCYRMELWKSYGVEITYRLQCQGKREECLELLQLAETLGPIVGIFNTSLSNGYETNEFFDSISPEYTSLATRNLDELSRKLCPSLKYFIVFSRCSVDGNDMEVYLAESAIASSERIIEERVGQGFPGKMIQWMSLEGKAASAGILSQKIISCLNVIDKLMLSSKPVVSHKILVREYVKEKNILDLLKKVLELDEIKSLDSTVKEFTSDFDVIKKLKLKIREEFHLTFTRNSFTAITFRQLVKLAAEKMREIKGNLVLANDRKPQGLEMLLPHLRDSNLIAKKKITKIPSRDRSTKYTCCMIVIPGLVEILEPELTFLSLNVSLPVFSLHITPDIGLLSIEELAKTVYHDLKENALKTCDSFYLVGYSFGVFLTLEVARLLEQDGLNGQILLIDGAPDFLKLLLIDQFDEEFTQKDIDDLIVGNILRIIFPHDNLQDVPDDWCVTTWQERVEKLVEVSKSQYVYNEEYIRYIAESLHNKVEHILNAGKIEPINSPISLVRPTDVSVMDIERDYGVASLTRGKFHLRFIDGDHITILRNKHLTQVINEFDPWLNTLRNFQDYIDI